ncbi:hypothetical protein RZ71_09180 [Apilactobacillus kunkeei]|uniref:AlwI restriction endonuclease n=1 Tax=Apilactobacillus kunkeei TaxID=148814 RepID=A0A0N0CT22_9LACO|nr:AlwI family type II restriction endonuclease [Apilactobacillus kunkeei]KOY77019.1 hypothetical protein RZ71_09180 [Apilactobacillus kunkeei]
MQPYWRTAPRSLIRTIESFKCVNSIVGENWNYTDKSNTSNYNKLIYPTRRRLLCDIAKKEEEQNGDISSTYQNILKLGYDDFLSGQTDWTKDPESNARQLKATFDFFGFSYTDDNGSFYPTQVGETIINETFNSETILNQLMKLYFPFKNGGGIFIFEEFIKLLNEFNYLNRWEIAFLFCPSSSQEKNKIFDAILNFRKTYNEHKSDKEKNKVAWKKTYEQFFSTKLTKTQEKDCGRSYWTDYSDAFIRSIIFTDIFIDSGRGESTKIRVKDLERDKFNLLLSFNFQIPDYSLSSKNQIKWYGKKDNVLLPWNNHIELIHIVSKKLKKLQTKNLREYNNLTDKFKISNNDISNLTDYEIKSLESHINNFYTNENIVSFVKKYSKEDKARNEIIKRYDSILNSNEDLSALWLEVNTWKFFASITNDPKSIKYNGKVNPDLTPRSFAKGVGNTPDMEVYDNDNILLPEVSLMSGVKQWEHEGASVAEHVYRKKEDNRDKNVFSIFISKKTHFRSLWMFFILNKDSWAGYPINIIPIDIETFTEIAKTSYKNNLKSSHIIDLVQYLSKTVNDVNDFTDWSNVLKHSISTWAQKNTKKSSVI